MASNKGKPPDFIKLPTPPHTRHKRDYNEFETVKALEKIFEKWRVSHCFSQQLNAS